MRPSSGDDKKTKYDVAVKLAYDTAGIRLLRHEYEIYSKDLRALQGSVIPICYGLFTGMVNCAHTACLVLEYCANGHPNPAVAGEEFYRKLMLGICKIHQAGIVHNALHSYFHVMQHGEEPRIIDFSRARRHNCRGAYPADRYGDFQGSAEIPWCMELAKMEGVYGMKSGDPPDQHEWASLVPTLSQITQRLSNIAFYG
ncbi:hypothetical protein M413DRAFT_205213 [Hebeloma cylindrosporum]|uniref:Protein kinase domain-containing protein n=1 Tax=Hebeloma cylindrosporum TaxID=76867 RepID=A0A0C3CUW2_HEBCY|nr:hypothetical protein M413DRAFT_205213 [Hebeloma cylindrosporum h7]